MPTNPTSSAFDWSLFRDDWCAEARQQVPIDLPDCLPRNLRSRVNNTARVQDAVERSLVEACMPQLLDTPWLFPNQRYFTRWVTVTASRCLLGVTLPRRVVLPLLGEVDQPFCAMLAYYRADSFRVASDLCYVFEPMTPEDVLRFLQQAQNRWQACFVR